MHDILKIFTQMFIINSAYKIHFPVVKVIIVCHAVKQKLDIADLYGIYMYIPVNCVAMKGLIAHTLNTLKQ